MLIRLPPATSLTTPSRRLPLVITSTPGPPPPLRERTEPFFRRSAGIGCRFGTRLLGSALAAPERVSCATAAGPVQSPPDSTFAAALANAAENPSIAVDASA